MNKNYLYILPLALLLAGSPGNSVAQDTECATGPANPPPCEEVGGPHAKMVNLNLNKLAAHPHCIRVDEGTTIVFSLTPKKDLKRDTVEIIPKDVFGDSWLKGKNDVFNDLIIIMVPEEDKPDEPAAERPPTVHDYSIYLSNGDCLDPRVEVRH